MTDGSSTSRTLEGKTALLTGAVRRNGRAAALALARDGASIVLNCRKSVEEGNALVKEIAALPSSTAAPS
jgi:3-oxoacyl-[acyl-carrier protein] reductase